MAESNAPVRARSLEQAMLRVRWAGIAFGALQLAFFPAAGGVPVPSSVVPTGYGVLGALLVVQLTTIAVLRRDPSPDLLRRLGAVNFVADLAAIWAFVWLFNFEPAGVTWVIITFGCLEGALRYGLAGAMIPVVAALALEPLRELSRRSTFGFPFQLDALSFRLGVMAIIAFVAGTMARSLRRERERAEHRARLLSTVASAGRTMSRLDHEVVMGAVVAASAELGFEASELCVFEPGGTTYRVRHASGLPAAYVAAPQPAQGSLAGLARALRETVFVEDYSRFEPGVSAVREAGFHAAIATPVWSGSSIVATLIAGTRKLRAVSSEEREAFELLAAHAGRAHENASRFAAERDTVERLGELDRLKREFLSMVSHELRTPLTAIEGIGLTLERSWEALDDEARRQLLARINANTRALDGIIVTMLDFSRLESGSLRAHPNSFDLSEQLRSVVSRMTDLLGEHQVGVDVQPGLLVSADSLLIDRVIENLLSNAVKHTPKGTDVRLRAKADGAVALVSITDAGPGIDPVDMPHLGQRFYRGGTPNGRQTKGIGLGLALVREILVLHGTDLEISSTLGEGARFSFALPLVSATALEARAQPP